MIICPYCSTIIAQEKGICNHLPQNKILSSACGKTDLLFGKEVGRILFCQRSLEQLDQLNHRDDQDRQRQGNAVLGDADGGKAKGVCDEGHFDHQCGQHQAS